MPVNLSIKGVPDELAQRLRERAERHHRSLQGELMAIIEQAAVGVPPQPPFGDGTVVRGSKSIGQLVAERQQRAAGGPLGVADILAQMRALHPNPPDTPDSTQIIRDMRDSR